MEVRRPGGSNSSSAPACYEEASGSVAVVVIPALLGVSTAVVVALIFCSILRRRSVRPLSSTGSPPQDASSQRCFSLGAVPVLRCGVREALHPWEMQDQWDVDGLALRCWGRYGPVCTGRLTAGGRPTAVVVKSLRGARGDPCEEREFAEWILFHTKVCGGKSPRLVRMLCCQTLRRPLYLVLEALSPGNLLHFLWALREDSDQRGAHVSERTVYLLATQVAEGLDYLMTEHRVVHGYVAARNILIGPDLSARVSGFGTAFAGHQTEDRGPQRRPRQVPLKWLAPESITDLPAFHRSDVWSFGILLYELITSGSPPYPELDPQSVLPYLESSYRMKRPEGCGAPLYNLMEYCWTWNFKDRPSYSAIVTLLESTLDLAATDALPARGPLDPARYNEIAGIQPPEWEGPRDLPVKQESSVC